jgi:hypothetical protein
MGPAQEQSPTGVRSRWRDRISGWCEGRWWQWRAPVLLLVTWNGLRQLQDPAARGLFGGITFGAHEFGHLFFAPFGEFMGVAGGSLMQLLVPIGAIALLLRHGDYFGVAVGGAWLASSLVDLALYIGDARAYDLDLVGFGEDAVHDWAWLLGHAGALQHDLRLAGLARGLGALLLAAVFLAGAWLCLQMATRTRNPGADTAS